MIYLDHHATTPLRPEAAAAMAPWWSARFGNAASVHAVGRAARQAVEDARDRVASCLGARSTEVVFTSGATESNNLAIFGQVFDPPGRIVASPIEHPCVTEPLKKLAQRGFTVESLPVGNDGIVDPSDIPADTRLVVLMAVNHETGAVQPKVPAGSWRWHCDAAQAAGKRPVNFAQLGPTSLSISGHKFGGPQGVGALLIREGVTITRHLLGGGQQGGRRPGTEPVALIAGMAAALNAACGEMTVNAAKVGRLRDHLLRRLQKEAEPVLVNGPADAGLQSPYVLNVSFPGVRADALLMALDIAGVACSAGSACSSGSLLPSPVLRAMNLPDAVVRSAVRFSFASSNTREEMVTAANIIVAAVRRLRNLASTP